MWILWINVKCGFLAQLQGLLAIGMSTGRHYLVTTWLILMRKLQKFRVRCHVRTLTGGCEVGGDAWNFLVSTTYLGFEKLVFYFLSSFLFFVLLKIHRVEDSHSGEWLHVDGPSLIRLSCATLHNRFTIITLLMSLGLLRSSASLTRFPSSRFVNSSLWVALSYQDEERVFEFTFQ